MQPVCFLTANNYKSRFISVFLFITICFTSCSTTTKSDKNNSGSENTMLADVISVQVSGSAGVYTFSVGIKSPDTGCDQYADWWEILSTDGKLLYRRILIHSHVNEQPFIRSGGPVEIAADELLYVRAHMHPDGYGETIFKGSIQKGFVQDSLSADFASLLEAEPPQPEGCAF